MKRPLKISFVIFIGVAVLFCAIVLYRKGLVRKDHTAEARAKNQAGITRMFADAKIPYPPRHLFIRVFKMEKILELWASDSDASTYRLIKQYPICRLRQISGPKRKEGDSQTPEGFYVISQFNPRSRFYLSMRVNYPNESDLILSDKKHPGKDIFIHGSCVSDGCIAIENGPISELYIIALDTNTRNQEPIPIHIFPCRMDQASCQNQLRSASAHNKDLEKFWNSIEPGYQFFEQKKLLPKIKVNPDGYYSLVQ